MSKVRPGAVGEARTVAHPLNANTTAEVFGQLTRAKKALAKAQQEVNERDMRLAAHQLEVKVRDEQIATLRSMLNAFDDTVHLDLDDEFDKVILDMITMYRRKRADYTQVGGDILENFIVNADSMRLEGYDVKEDIKAMIFRKLHRLTALRGREAQNESVQDSAIDVAVYGTLLAIAYRRPESLTFTISNIQLEEYDGEEEAEPSEG